MGVTSPFLNLPIVLAPLIPEGLPCMVVNAWHNGEALDFNLVNCFDGFFVQINVACGRTLMDNLIAAVPIVSLGMRAAVSLIWSMLGLTS